MIYGPWNSIAEALRKLFQERILKEKTNHVKALAVASEIAVAERGISIVIWQCTVHADLHSCNDLLKSVHHDNCSVRSLQATVLTLQYNPNGEKIIFPTVNALEKFQPATSEFSAENI